MSNIRDRGVIDITLVEDNRFVLIILDDIEWNYSTRVQHARMLQDKINDYLDFIASGQAEDVRPGLRPVIRVLARCSYSRYCIDYLERVRNFVKNKDDICDIEWTHSDEDGPFDDGFSDDFTFDIDKIYPRLKKNWAENPLQEVSLMAPNSDAPNYPDQMVMSRIMDSFIGLFMQDMGNVFTYISYDMLPEGVTAEQLNVAAFENLIRDVHYRTCESKEPGIYGIIAGGDFEAESILLNDIWKSVSDELGDDIVITIPTKDIVYYTKAGDKKLRKKMMKMATEMFESNQKETPYLIFCKDVFIYSRQEGRIIVTKEKI